MFDQEKLERAMKEYAAPYTDKEGVNWDAAVTDFLTDLILEESRSYECYAILSFRDMALEAEKRAHDIWNQSNPSPNKI